MRRIRRRQHAVDAGTPVRVAVIGAGGIGKHHAKWWALCGAEVCAIAGSSRASAERAKSGLKTLFNFDGRAYAGMDSLLRHEAPDIVDVCSPPSLHYAHADAALSAGCDVLCEKPFVYDPDLPHDTLMRQAQSLVDRAYKAKRRLSVCCQYVYAAKFIRRIWRNRERLRQVRMVLQAPARDRSADPRRIWADLAPHPISLLLALAPSGHVDWTSVRARFDGYEASAHFRYPIQGTPTLECEFVVRNSTAQSGHVRQVALNGHTFDVHGLTDASGLYRAQIVAPEGRYTEQDMMHALICDFLHKEPVVDFKPMLANLSIMLRILECTA